MRLVYADPPYPGQSEKHYGDHPDFAGEVDLPELAAQLVEFDGWALSTSNQGLTAALLALTAAGATGVRTLAWCKPTALPFRNHGIFGWEPVLVRPARPVASDLRDWLVCSPELYTFRPKPKGYVTGSKPPSFSRWLFGWLGAEQDDDFTDLFPGSRAVSDAWRAFQLQGVLL